MTASDILATADALPSLPAELHGWKWHKRTIQTNGSMSTEYWLQSPTSWTTKAYQDPDRTIAEAKRRVMSQPKPVWATPAPPADTPAERTSPPEWAIDVSGLTDPAPPSAAAEPAAVVRRTRSDGIPVSVPPATAPPLLLADLMEMLDAAAATVVLPLTPETIFIRPAGLPPYVLVPITLLSPGRYQPRTEFNEDMLTELAESIAEIGIKTALKVFANEHGRLELIAGERRMRASTKLGLTFVPVEIDDHITLRGVADLSFIDNMQRADLTPLEEGIALDRMIRDMGSNESAFAKRMSKDRGWVRQRLAIARAAPELRDALKAGAITFTQARTITTHAATPAAQQKALAAISMSSVPLTEKRVQELAEQAELHASKKELRKLGWSVVEQGDNWNWQRPIVFAPNVRPEPWSGADISAVVRERRTPTGTSIPAVEALNEAQLCDLRRCGYYRVDVTKFAPWVFLNKDSTDQYITGDELLVALKDAQLRVAALADRVTAVGWVLEWDASDRVSCRLLSVGGVSISCYDLATLETKIAAIEAGEVLSVSQITPLERACADCGARGGTIVSYRHGSSRYICRACGERIEQADAAERALLNAAIETAMAPLLVGADERTLQLLALSMVENGNGGIYGETGWCDVATLGAKVLAMQAADLPGLVVRQWQRKLGSGLQAHQVATLLDLPVAVSPPSMAGVDNDIEDAVEELTAQLDDIEEAIKDGAITHPAEDLDDLDSMDAELQALDAATWLKTSPRIVRARAELQRLMAPRERHDLAFVVRELAGVEATITNGTYGPAWEDSEDALRASLTALRRDLDGLAVGLDDATYETLANRLSRAVDALQADAAVGVV